MKICDVSSKPLAACCAFKYRGFTVSVSTIFRPASVAVFNADGSDAAPRDFDTVEAALDFCDGAAVRKLRAALAECVTSPDARCLRQPSGAAFIRRLAAISKTAADALEGR